MHWAATGAIVVAVLAATALLARVAWVTTYAIVACKGNLHTPQRRDAMLAHWERHDAIPVVARVPAIVFVGLAKDIRAALDASLRGLEALGAQLPDYRILVVENDSTDGTAELLRAAARRNPKIRAQCFTENAASAVTHGAHSLRRFAKMAYWRNKYLDELRDNPEYAAFEYVCVLDLDHRAPILLSSVATCFERTDWDMVSANGIHYADRFDMPFELRLFMNPNDYYDKLALRTAAGERVRGHNPKGTVDCKGYSTRQREWVPVTSAFGGATLYRREALLSARYDGYDCEHVALHDDMIRHGHARMYINPRFVLRH